MASAPCLLNQVRSMMLHVGQLSELSHGVLMNAPSHISYQSTCVEYHLFHMYLELHWAVIEILHHLPNKYPGVLEQSRLCYKSHSNEQIEGDMFYQAVYLLMSNITALACRKYNQVSAQDLSSCDVSAFECTCVRELCVMLRHLLNYRQQHMAKESLLVIIQHVVQDVLKAPANDRLNEIDSDSFALPVYDCKDPLGFAWWFLSHLITVFKIDQCGEFTSGVIERAQGIQLIVHDLVKRTCIVPEGELRHHLRLLLEITSHLPADIQVIITLWETFYKRLNDLFSISSSSLNSLTSILDLPSKLLDHSQAIVKNDVKSVTFGNSFTLFLHLLCVELQKHGKTGAANPEWRSFKGRLYSKFHSRRMQGLSEVGLQNFGLLFLCLAQVADTQELIGKMCEHYSSLNVAALDTRKRKMIWKGSFAAMMLCCERDVDVSFLADKLVSSLNAVAGILSDPKLEPSRYNDLWQLIELYTESTQEVIEYSNNLDLHQHVLIGSGYQQVLAVCRENHMRFILDFVLAVLTKLRLICRNKSESGHHGNVSKVALSYALWKYFYPFTKQHSCTQTPPPQVADTAVGFTLLFLAVPPRAQSGLQESLVGCFTYFALNENVNPKVSCRYLGHVLPNTEIITRIANLGHCDLDTYIIKAWIRCAWQLLPSNQEMQQLSRSVEKLACVQALQSDYSVESDTPVIQFVERLGHKYESCQGWKSRLEFRDKANQYFSDVPKQLPVLLKNCSSSEQMCSIYIIAGHMVKHCAQLFYLQSKPDCLLPMLLDKLVLPRALLTPGKQLPAHIMSALKKSLYLFVIGLGRLDYKKDPFIQRKLRDIVLHYLPRFSLTGSELAQSVTSVHPLLVALDKTFWNDVTSDAAQLRAYVLGAVKSEHLILRGVASPQTASSGWQWIIECEKRTLNQSQVAMDSLVLLRTCLDYILVVDNPHIKQQASRVLQYLLEAIDNRPEAVDNNVLQGIMRSFIQSQLMLYQARVLRVVESVAVICSSFVRPCISVMTESVRAVEAKRGVGIDKQLRACYYSLLVHLGEPGEREKTRLIQSSMTS